MRRVPNPPFVAFQQSIVCSIAEAEQLAPGQDLLVRGNILRVDDKAEPFTVEMSMEARSARNPHLLSPCALPPSTAKWESPFPGSASRRSKLFSRRSAPRSSTPWLCHSTDIRTVRGHTHTLQVVDAANPGVRFASGSGVFQKIGSIRSFG